jgi:hypothetical protein
MDDMIAYRIGSLKVVMRDDPDFIESLKENLILMGGCPGVHYQTADSSQVTDMATLFRGLA